MRERYHQRASEVGKPSPTSSAAGAVVHVERRPTTPWLSWMFAVAGSMTDEEINKNPAQAPTLRTFEEGGVHRCVGMCGEQESIESCACLCRCVPPDTTAQTANIHYAPGPLFRTGRSRLPGCHVFFPMEENPAPITSILHASVGGWRCIAMDGRGAREWLGCTMRLWSWFWSL